MSSLWSLKSSFDCLDSVAELPRILPFERSDSTVTYIVQAMWPELPHILPFGSSDSITSASAQRVQSELSHILPLEHLDSITVLLDPLVTTDSRITSMGPPSLQDLELQLKHLTKDFSSNDWEDNEPCLLKIRNLTKGPVKRSRNSTSATSKQEHGNTRSVESLSDLLALPENGRDAPEPVEVILGALRSEKDVTRHCDSNKIPQSAKSTAKAVFRSLNFPEARYKDIWSGFIFYNVRGSIACRCLEAERHISGDAFVNGARYRINALLFALDYNARVQALGTKAHRERIVVDAIVKESSRLKRQIELLLKKGRWYALWVSKFGIGAILALGEFQASNDNIKDFPSLVKVCEMIHGFRQRSRTLYPFARKAIDQAAAPIDASPQADVTRITSRLITHRDSICDQQQLEGAQGSTQQLQQASSGSSCTSVRPGTHLENDPLQMLTEVAPSDSQVRQTTQHRRTENPQHHLPQATPDATSSMYPVCGQYTSPQCQSGSGSSWSHGPAQFVGAPLPAGYDALHTMGHTGDQWSQHSEETLRVRGPHSNALQFDNVVEFVGPTNTLTDYPWRNLTPPLPIRQSSQVEMPIGGHTGSDTAHTGPAWAEVNEDEWLNTFTGFAS